MGEIQEQLWQRLNAAAGEELPYLSGLRRELHQHPELAMEERNTAQVIRRELVRWGIPCRSVGETGVLGVLEGEGPGAGITALRADIDALPIREQNTHSYISRRPGCMHACGHDAHTAMLIGAAKLLAQYKSAWGGQVRFLFQPGEETGQGAEDFLTAGALEGVNRALGLHVAPDLALGTLGVKPGPNNAAVESFRITVQGRSTHVSTPEQGVDALYIGSHIVVALQAQAARRTSPVEPLILGIGTFHSGSAYNALAETAVLEGTTRTVSEEARKRARAQVDATARQVSELYGGSACVEWTHVASALVNHEAASREITRIIRAQRPELTVISNRPYSLSGDNFSEFQLQAPGVYVYLGTAGPNRPETCHQIHDSHFEIDEKALPIGAWIYTAAALGWSSLLPEKTGG